MGTITFMDLKDKDKVENYLDDLKKQALLAWESGHGPLSIHTHTEKKEIGGGLVGFPAYFVTGFTYGVSIGEYPTKEGK